MMMENRSLKELYELLKIHFIEIYPNFRGLCATITNAWDQKKIKYSEYLILRDDFEKTRPKVKDSIWSWDMLDYQSRIEFLENRIKELT